MVRRPNLFKYFPIRLRIFSYWDAFLQLSDICSLIFRWETTVIPKSALIKGVPQGSILVQFCLMFL
jgi:hypothetical protein